MLTVLPTPAPPKRPTLPPLANGQTRSMTLMPVSNSSVDGDNSSNVGASRWIDIVFSARPGAAVGDRPAEDVHDASERLRAHRDHDRPAGVANLHPAPQAIRGSEAD